MMKKKNFTSFGQPTRLITCANHGNTAESLSTDSVLIIWVDYLSFDSLSVQVRLHTSLPGLLSGSTQKKPCRSNWNLHRRTKLLL